MTQRKKLKENSSNQAQIISMILKQENGFVKEVRIKLLIFQMMKSKR
tara:strand:- start:212 stop:352 length:141 start_codon:yes stop_codon:yes gene_type:complete